MAPITIRRFRDGDEYAVAKVVAETLQISNSRDYPQEYILENMQTHSAGAIRERAGESHFYVACDGGAVIGCGGITGYWGSTTESYLVTIFVLPAYQGRGIGRRIVNTLESDEYFRRAWRTEVGSSLTAVDFYRKMGYAYKNGVTEPDRDGVVRLEKRTVRCPCKKKTCERHGNCDACRKHHAESKHRRPVACEKKTVSIFSHIGRGKRSDR